MKKSQNSDRLAPPIMYAFRSAHAEGVHRRRDRSIPATDSEQKMVAARNRRRTPITEAALRADVARDLSALVNTISLESAIDLSAFDAVRNSILNYGIRDLNSRFADQIGKGDLARDVAAAIRRYEPRIAADSVFVRNVGHLNESSLTVRLEISAELFCEPVNVPVVFVADIDVDNCEVAVSRAS